MLMYSRFLRRFTTLLLAVVPLAVAGHDARADQSLNILFFGNSFSQYNNLPTLVKNIAVADGHESPLVVADLYGGTYLSYHMAQVDSYSANNVNHATITGKTWDYVVIQGYSLEATHQGNPDVFRANAQTLYTKVRDHSSGRGIGCTAVLYETWGRGDRAGFPIGTMQDEITAQYRQAAQEINVTQGVGSARVATVGETFQSMNFSRSLYDSAMYHPSMSGSLLAAMVIYRTIYDETLADVSFADVQSWAGVNETTWNSLVTYADASPIVAPEPASLLIVLPGLALLATCRSKRSKLS